MKQIIHLKIFTIFVLSILLNYLNLSIAQTAYDPSRIPQEERTKAQGTRGCPQNLGELSLLGKQIQTSINPPSLLFEFHSQTTAILKVTVQSPDGEPPVLDRTIAVSGAGILLLKLPKLQSKIQYRIVAGIRCMGYRMEQDKVLTTTLEITSFPTFYDRLIKMSIAEEKPTYVLEYKSH